MLPLLLDTEKALLKLDVGYYSAPDASEAGLIIERLSNAYARNFASSSGARLALAHVEIGSIKAWLEIANSIHTLYEQRTMLGDLVRQLAVGAQMLTDSGSARVPAAIRSFLALLVKPISEDRADHASVNVHGDNNNIFVIGHAEADAIRLAIESTPRSRSAPERPKFTGPALYAARARTDDDRPAKNLAEIALVQYEGMKTHATAIKVDEAWYARPAGMNGVLVPIRNASPILDKVRAAKPLVEGKLVFGGGGAGASAFEILSLLKRKSRKAPL